MKTLYYASPFQTVFKISTNCELLASMIRLKYGKYIYEQYPLEFTENNISVNKQGDNYLIEAGDYSFFTQDPLFHIDKYISENVTYDQKIWAMHGAAVEYHKRAYLFVAPTASGKTTLTAYLTSLDFGYIAEDCVLVDRSTFVIYPCTSPLMLRKGGVEVLNKVGVLQTDLKKVDMGTTCRYVYEPLHCVDYGVSLGGIFFISRSVDTNMVMDLDSTKKVDAFLKSPIKAYELTADYLRFIVKLSQNDCQLLLYKDMNYVAHTIRNRSQIFG